MKKFILAFLVVFAANLGCKKLDDGDKPCACSPISEPTLVLVLKNASGADVLNPVTSGYFSNNNIKLYYLEGGVQKQLNFFVRPSFSYGAEKFDYYQLHSSEIIRQHVSGRKDFYLKLRDNEPKKINLEIATDKQFSIEKVLVDGMVATPEKGAVSSYVQHMFYVQL